MVFFLLEGWPLMAGVLRQLPSAGVGSVLLALLCLLITALVS